MTATQPDIDKPPHPPAPQPPEPDDCCGEGCIRCVWDVYDEALERWRELHGDAAHATAEQNRLPLNQEAQS